MTTLKQKKEKEMYSRESIMKVASHYSEHIHTLSVEHLLAVLIEVSLDNRDLLIEIKKAKRFGELMNVRRKNNTN